MVGCGGFGSPQLTSRETVARSSVRRRYRTLGSRQKANAVTAGHCTRRRQRPRVASAHPIAKRCHECLTDHIGNFVQTPDRACWPPVWFGTTPPISREPLENCEHQVRSTTIMAVFSSWSMTKSNTACGLPSPMFPRGGGWYTAKPTVRRALTTSSRTGPISGRRVCASGWQRVGVLISKPPGYGDSGGALGVSHGTW